jgi:hypothetical protein
MLISAVKCRPILWDKSQDLYKDRNRTKYTWEEVCIKRQLNLKNLKIMKRTNLVSYI